MNENTHKTKVGVAASVSLAHERSDENEKQMKWKRNSFLGSFFISSLIGKFLTNNKRKARKRNGKKEKETETRHRDVHFSYQRTYKKQQKYMYIVHVHEGEKEEVVYT